MKSHKFLRTGWKKKKKSYKVTKGQQKYNLKIDTIEKARLDPEREIKGESAWENVYKNARRKKEERRKKEKKNEGRKNEIRENEGNDFKKLKSKYTYIFHEIITKFVSKWIWCLMIFQKRRDESCNISIKKKEKKKGKNFISSLIE